VIGAGQNGQTGVRDQPVRRRPDIPHGVDGNVFEIAHALNAQVLRMGRRREIRVPQYFWHLSKLGVFEFLCQVAQPLLKEAALRLLLRQR